jgi:fatty acid synthase subunit alpha
MKDIEITTSETGPNVRLTPFHGRVADNQVKLTGDALSAAGGKTIKVSLSHSDTSVVAFAVAQ